MRPVDPADLEVGNGQVVTQKDIPCGSPWAEVES